MNENIFRSVILLGISFLNILIFGYLNLALQDGRLILATNQKKGYQMVAQFSSLQLHTLILTFIHNYSFLEELNAQ